MMKIKPLFTFEKLSARLLNHGDLDAIKNLLAACADFSILITGKPEEPNAASGLLLDCPPGIDLKNKYLIGFFDSQKTLVGLLDAINGYPETMVWFIGLLIFLPEYRNKGLGRSAINSFENWIRPLGAKEIRLGIVEVNKAAIRFWEKMGFNLLEKRPPVTFGLKKHVVLVYRYNLY